MQEITEAVEESSRGGKNHCRFTPVPRPTVLAIADSSTSDRKAILTLSTRNSMDRMCHASENAKWTKFRFRWGRIESGISDSEIEEIHDGCDGKV